MTNTRKFSYGNQPYAEVLATTASHKVLEEYLSLVVKELKIEQKIERQLLIVLDEIFSNIVKYANVEAESYVKVEISHYMQENTLELKFTDKGNAYNPLEAPTPDVNASIEERSIGGLGLFMVKKMMDSVDYKREGDYNILALRKSLNPSD